MDASIGDDINYEFIIFSHINKLSNVLTVVETEMFSANATTNTMRFKERGEDKLDSFVWGVKLFVRMIPNNLRDKTYIDELNSNLREFQNKIDPKTGELPKAFDDFFSTINLLDRKGFLLKNKVIGRERARNANASN